ncbi:MAG: NADAR family protein [Halioglobus sp.]|nr:NADAR family protein [Halioglobus sp.]
MIFETRVDNAIYLSRTDANHPLSSFSKHGFDLDGFHWPSVEHYFQGMKSEDAAFRSRVAAAAHPREARRLGRNRRVKLRKDWKQLRRVIMTRAVYTKCKTHPEVAEALLATGDNPLVAQDAYDYFWGCGRDGRGYNTYGAVLTDVRNKLREEQRQNTAES